MTAPSKPIVRQSTVQQQYAIFVDLAAEGPGKRCLATVSGRDSLSDRRRLVALAPEGAAIAAGRLLLKELDHLAEGRLDFAFERP